MVVKRAKRPSIKQKVEDTITSIASDANVVSEEVIAGIGTPVIPKPNIEQRREQAIQNQIAGQQQAIRDRIAEGFVPTAEEQSQLQGFGDFPIDPTTLPGQPLAPPVPQEPAPLESEEFDPITQTQESIGAATGDPAVRRAAEERGAEIRALNAVRTEIEAQAIQISRILTSNFSDFLGQTAGRTTPGQRATPTPEQVLNTFNAQVEADPAAFLDSVYNNGRTPDMVFVLSAIGMSDEQIDDFFIGAPGGAPTVLQASVRNLFPGFDVDKILAWMQTSIAEQTGVARPLPGLQVEGPLPGGDFFEVIQAMGLNEDTWALMQSLLPEVPKSDLVNFFQESPVKSDEGVLSLIAPNRA